jgi:hypothetical protein
LNKPLNIIFLVIVAAFFYWLGSLNASNSTSPENKLYADKQLSNEPKTQSSNHQVPNASLPNNTSNAELSSDLVEDLTNNKKTYEELAEELATLTKTSDGVNAEFYRLKQRYDAARTRLLKAGLDEPTSISKEEVSKILPPPFDGVVANSSPDFIDKFKDLHEEEQDYDWAIQMESKISDFFALHENRDLVELVKVNCKKSQCEIYGHQQDSASLTKLMQDLQSQEWFFAVQTNSMTGDISSDEENDTARSYFYMMANMFREEIVQ